LDAELGDRLQGLRQEEITQVFENKQSLQKENPIAGVMAVSVDATKLRERGERNELLMAKGVTRAFGAM
jgi:hypothetical protein